MLMALMSACFIFSSIGSYIVGIFVGKRIAKMEQYYDEE